MKATKNFTAALQEAEVKAMFDLDGQWCVTVRYGVYLACPLRFAINRDYHVVCVTIY